MADIIEQVANAFVTPLCSTCGLLGMEPVCVVSDAARGGNCACVHDVVSNLLNCPSATTGSNVLVMDNSQYGRKCLAALDSSLSMSLNAMSFPGSIVQQFSDYAVAECFLATGHNLCMQVMIPYTDSASMRRSGTQKLVVLFNLISGYGRRLLALPHVPPPEFLPALADLLQSEHTTTATLVGTLTAKHHLMSLVTKSLVHAGALAYCGGPSAASNTSAARRRSKRCIETHAWVAYTLRAHNLSLWYGQEQSLVELLTTGTLPMPNTTRVASMLQLLQQPGWVWDSLYDSEFTHQLVHIPYAIFAPVLHNKGRRRGNSSGSPQRESAVPSSRSNTSRTSHSNRRRLLATDALVQTPGINLTEDIQWSLFVSNPFSSIVEFAGVTALYYTQQQYSKAMPQCNDTGLLACVGYSMPPQTRTVPPTAISYAADALLMLPLLGNGGSRVLDALLSDMPYNESVAKDYITGTRLVHDLSTCDYTVLTLGTARPKNLLAIVLLVGLFLILMSTFCCPFSCGSFVMWAIIFPPLVLWGAYNISPLCMPMVPPTLARDIYVEVQTYLPKSFVVPATFTRPSCTSEGIRRADGVFDSNCFLRCKDRPFLMVSWQDTLAWWLCELSADMCVGMARWVDITTLLPDFVSSAYYYADVIRFSVVDTDFVSAHRMCAVFTLYNLGFILVLFMCAVWLLPSVCIALFDMLTGLFVFLIDVQTAESAGDSGEAADD